MISPKMEEVNFPIILTYFQAQRWSIYKRTESQLIPAATLVYMELFWS